MNEQLDSFRHANEEKGASLEKFQNKLSGIRKAMFKEVDKVLHVFQTEIWPSLLKFWVTTKVDMISTLGY